MEIIKTLNAEKADEIMNERGYGRVSTIRRGEEEDLCYAKTVDIGVCLHATVDVKRMNMSLEMVELKYFANISMKRFDFFHKDFEKIEKILYLYSRVCKDIDPHIFDLVAEMDPIANKLPDGSLIPLNLPGSPPPPTPEEKPKKEKKTIKERKMDFWLQIAPIAKQKGLTKEFTMDFFSYWSEHGPNDKTFRREREKVFDISRRLDTFVKNEKKWT